MNMPAYKAATPRPALLPDQYAGDYLLSLFLSITRQDFRLFRKAETGEKIFTRAGYFYVAAFRGKAPPREGFLWSEIGAIKSRKLYSGRPTI